MLFRKAGNESGATDDILRDRILAIAARVMREQGIESEPRLDIALGEDGLGLDSMRRLELLRAVEQEFGVTLPEAYWGPTAFRDLDDVAKVVSKL